MAEYLGQDLVALDVRPKRSAYLYRTGSATQFRVAVEHASSRWGGIQEPIVPVSSGGRIQPYWKQLLDVLQPDVVFDVSELSRDATNVARDQLGRDVLPIAMESSPLFGAHALTVVHTPADIVASVDRSVGSSVGAGVLPSWDAQQAWSDAGLQIQLPTGPAEVGSRQLAGSTLIEATGTACGEVYGAGLFSGFALVWIAEQNSLRDALWFWNMRALMPRMVTPARAAIVPPSTATDPTFVDDLHRMLRTPEKWTTPDVVVLSLTVSPRRLRTLAKKMRLDIPTDGRLSVHMGNARSDSDPLTAAVNIDPRNYLHGERLEGLRSSTPITITRPRTMLRVASPVAFAASAGGHLRVRISGPSFLNVPRRQVLANMFISNATWRAQSLEVETNPNGIYHFDLLVPTHVEMLHAILQESQINIETSQPGRLATAVLSRAGTAEPMATPESCEIVRSLTTPRSRTLAKELASQLSLDADASELLLIAERVGSQLAQIHRTVADVSGLTSLPRTKSSGSPVAPRVA